MFSSTDNSTAVAESVHKEFGEGGTLFASGESPQPMTGGEREGEMFPPRQRAVRFTQDETNVLLREVKARQCQIFGTSSQPPCRSVVNQAWTEVAAAVSVSSGIPRSVKEVKKRFDTCGRRKVCCLYR